jgi:hypothetical protein
LNYSEAKPRIDNNRYDGLKLKEFEFQKKPTTYSNTPVQAQRGAPVDRPDGEYERVRPRTPISITYKQDARQSMHQMRTSY